MRRIYEEKSQTQIELALATYKDAASITRILHLLHNKNMVRRIPNETDRRKSCLILTKKGGDTINSAYAVVAQLRAEGLEGISNEELQVAKRVMNKIAQNMKTT
jgi:MarR family transcriptional regulator for hemolysin